MQTFLKQTKIVQRNILRLIISPHFLIISLLGNVIIVLFAILILKLEQNAGGPINTFMDALWWSFSTATTVGYGDITPITDYGRYIGIALMLLGTALFATYTALFAQAILGREFRQIHRIEQRELTTNEQIYNLKMQLKELERHLTQLEGLQSEAKNKATDEVKGND